MSIEREKYINCEECKKKVKDFCKECGKMICDSLILYDDIELDFLNKSEKEVCDENSSIVTNNNILRIKDDIFIEVDTNLNIDYKNLYNFLLKLDKIIKKKFSEEEITRIYNNIKYSGITQHSHSTISFRYYNIFTVHNNDLHKIYNKVKELFYRSYKEYHKKETIDNAFYIEGWLNCNSKDTRIDWHSHGDGNEENWHGIIYINAETSCTSYKINENEQMDIYLKNGSMLMGKVTRNHIHKTSIWEKETERITIAFNIVCDRYDNENDIGFINHFIPL
jgi:hypothetical protein